MKNLITAVFSVSLFSVVPLMSNAGQCQGLLDKVDSYPKERLFELVQKAPKPCKMAVKEKIFKVRRVIVDDFGGR